MIPYGAHSMAAACVRPRTAHFVAEYGASSSNGRKATIDAAPMILPPKSCATIWRAAWRYEWKTPEMLTSRIFWKSSDG